MNNINNTTPFSIVYDSFLSKITDDMYMELNELDTFRILEDLLITAINKFEFLVSIADNCSSVHFVSPIIYHPLPL